VAGTLASMRLLSIVWAVAVLGCSDQRFTDLVAGDRVIEEILVDPASVTFEALEPGETVVRTIAVRNVGTTTLQLDGPPLLEGSAFSLLDPYEAMRLDPGESVSFEVAFSPVNIENTGRVTIASSAPEEGGGPETRVVLEGTGLFPMLQLSPDPFDLGAVAVGCSQDDALWLESVGTAPVVVSGASAVGSAFSLDASPSLTLEPGEVSSLPVWFGPMALGEHTGTLHVASDDPVGVRQVDLTGTGSEVFMVGDEGVVFENAMVGCETTEDVTLQYLGCDELVLSGVELVDGPFSLAEELDLPWVLDGGEERVIPMVFTPEAAGEVAATLRLYLEGEDAMDVELTGVGRPPTVSFDEEELVFDATLIGCEDSQEAVVRNPFDCPVTITDFTLGSSVFDLSPEPETPVVLEPGGRVDVPLTYLPDDFDLHRNELTVAVEGAEDKARLPLAGEALETDQTTDTFAFDGEFDAVDVLFWVDQSGSMEEEQADLGLQAEGYMAILETAGVDWQLGVVTDDDGCLNSGIITADSVDPGGSFASGVVGPSGDWIEAGLSVADAAFGASQGGCNDGLLRADAATRLVLVTDELEQSSESWSALLTDLQAASNELVVSAVAGDYPHGCPGAEAGSGYYEAVTATGGFYLSICDGDWSSHAAALASQADGIVGDTYVLSRTPIPETLVVEHNGDAFSAWSYDAVGNAVVIDDPADFSNGDFLTAAYTIAETCD